MSTTTVPTTCTVVVGSEMDRCGAPAVTTFTTRRGETFAECADHAMSDTTPSAPIAEGDTVTVEHVGKAKTGKVVRVRRTRAVVEVPLADGTTKRIDRSLSELVRI